MDLNALIYDSQIPEALKNHLAESKKLKSQINDTMVQDIEELFLYYQNFFKFNEADFSIQCIEAIARCKDADNFYYYLKKILSLNLDATIKPEPSSEMYFIDSSTFDETIESVTLELINLVDQIYNQEESIDLKATYINIGKLELINEIIADNYYKNLLKSSYQVIDSIEEH
ncbi:hypothetical protein [Alkalibacillus haloalkaliphilus]|uniref:hypothetical protein n=1 Tax=Alkalibacillus haloalkaliphilus TaxID=94136 RepID=UPI0029368042|nr:hypothetical protein [Alkalibacillus haloalkaliphilus]MDV2581582.1 hypothetical protein [Alkalibacillus haloalkaliphilus]